MVFVWSYRKTLLFRDRTRQLFEKRMLSEISERYCFEFDAIGSDGDHVQLFCWSWTQSILLQKCDAIIKVLTQDKSLRPNTLKSKKTAFGWWTVEWWRLHWNYRRWNNFRCYQKLCWKSGETRTKRKHISKWKYSICLITIATRAGRRRIYPVALQRGAPSAKFAFGSKPIIVKGYFPERKDLQEADLQGADLMGLIFKELILEELILKRLTSAELILFYADLKEAKPSRS